MNAIVPSPAAWPQIADALRAELAEYGALLTLFGEQQKRIFAREAAEVLRVAGLIERQVRVLDECRERREAVVSAFALAHGQPAGASIRSLLPCCEAPARPLLEALITEVNHLLLRVRRSNQRNHTLLARVVEINGGILHKLQPQAFSRTYSPAGRVSLMAGAEASTLRTAG